MRRSSNDDIGDPGLRAEAPVRTGLRAVVSPAGLAATAILGSVLMLPFLVMVAMGSPIRPLQPGPGADGLIFGLLGIGIELAGVVLVMPLLATVVGTVAAEPLAEARLPASLRASLGFALPRLLSFVLLYLGLAGAPLVGVSTGSGALAAMLIGLCAVLAFRFVLRALMVVPAALLEPEYRFTAAFGAGQGLGLELFFLVVTVAAVLDLPALAFVIWRTAEEGLHVPPLYALAIGALAAAATFVAVIAGATDLFLARVRFRYRRMLAEQG